MKFEDLKDAVSGETVLIKECKSERTFIGWSTIGDLVAQTGSGILYKYSEKAIAAWTLKKWNKQFRPWSKQLEEVWQLFGR